MPQVQNPYFQQGGQPQYYQPSYYQPQPQDQFIQVPIEPQIPTQPQQPQLPKLPVIEQSYIENILRLNRGKVASIYMNFENSQWGSKIFKGVLEEAGRDHIIIKDLHSETRYLLLSIYLNYITFDEEINYQYPFQGFEINRDSNNIQNNGDNN